MDWPGLTFYRHHSYVVDLNQAARRNASDFAEYVGSSVVCKQSGNGSKALYMNKKIQISKDLSPALISNNTLK